jgi:hypothetical protein
LGAMVDGGEERKRGREWQEAGEAEKLKGTK